MAKDGGTMKRAHPAVSIRNDAARRAQSLMSEFGLTPAARSRVNVEAPAKKEENPAAKFFA